MLRALFQQPEVRSQASAWGDWPGENVSTVVTESSALQLLAVSGCVRLITDSIATLPVDVFTESQGVKSEVSKPRWLLMPTVELDWTAWCTQILSSLLLHGNAYFVVTRNDTQAIVELLPLDPRTVTPYRDRGMVRYRVNGQPFPGELVHVRGMMLAGSDVGLSPLEYARQSIGLGLAAQNYGKDAFDNQLKMPGVIEAPRRLLPDQFKQIAEGWRKARRTGANGLPGVLDDGATWKPTGVTNEQAQFLQTRQWTAAEIAGQVFLVDPRELGIPVTGSTLDYTNGETRRAELLTKALLPWMIRVEKAISSLLPNPRYLKFNVDGFLCGDSASRWAVYEIASRINSASAAIGQAPVLLTSEMREFEDLNVIEESAPETPTDVPADPQMNSAQPVVVNVHAAETPQIVQPEQRADPSMLHLLERLAGRTESRYVESQHETHVHLPESVDVEFRQDGLAESLHALAAAQLRADDLAEVVTRAVVAALPVPVVPEPPQPTVRRVERDANGRILRVIDEVV